jgi:arabinose-5-phosphate isomerase
MGSIETGKKVLKTEANAILNALGKINQQFETAVDILFQCSGQVVITGMGKSGLIGRKIAATMTSIGSPAVFLHPAEAIHGDIGIIHPQDVVIALSTSGETEEVIRLLNYIKRLPWSAIPIQPWPDKAMYSLTAASKRKPVL